jgi:hypothetical protein
MAARKIQASKSPAPAAKSSVKKATSSASNSANAKVSPDKISKISPASKKQFRYSWSKKHPGAETIKFELDEASADYLRDAEHRAKATAAMAKSAKVSMALKCTKAITFASSAETPTAPTSSNKFDSLIDFNSTTIKANTGRSAPRSSPPKFLLGSKQRSAENERLDKKDADEADPFEEDGYGAVDTDEGNVWEEETDYEGEEEGAKKEGGEPNTHRKRKLLVKFSINVQPLTPSGEVIGPDHPSVPKSANDMKKHALRQSRGIGQHDPNGRYDGRVLVPWHREFHCSPQNIHIFRSMLSHDPNALLVVPD